MPSVTCSCKGRYTDIRTVTEWLCFCLSFTFQTILHPIFDNLHSTNPVSTKYLRTRFRCRRTIVFFLNLEDILNPSALNRHIYRSFSFCNETGAPLPAMEHKTAPPEINSSLLLHDGLLLMNIWISCWPLLMNTPIRTWGLITALEEDNGNTDF